MGIFLPQSLITDPEKSKVGMEAFIQKHPCENKQGLEVLISKAKQHPFTRLFSFALQIYCITLAGHLRFPRLILRSDFINLFVPKKVNFSKLGGKKKRKRKKERGEKRKVNSSQSLLCNVLQINFLLGPTVGHKEWGSGGPSSTVHDLVNVSMKSPCPPNRATRWRLQPPEAGQHFTKREQITRFITWTTKAVKFLLQRFFQAALRGWDPRFRIIQKY